MAQPSFSRRYGFRPEAEPVPYNEVPKPARVKLRELLDRHGNSLVGPSGGFPTLLRTLANHIGQLPGQGDKRQALDALIYECQWYEFFDICEKVLELCPARLKGEVQQEVNAILAENGIQYQMRDGRMEWRGGTPLFSEGVSKAQQLLSTSPKFQGPAQQLEKACKLLSGRPPDPENCIKDAIGALEGVARIMLEKDQVLSELLKPLACKLGMHPALREAIGKLYAYRGREEGIAHGATQPLKVGVEEAELVLHWCAAAIAYLLRKPGC